MSFLFACVVWVPLKHHDVVCELVSTDMALQGEQRAVAFKDDSFNLEHLTNLRIIIDSASRATA